MPRSGAYLVSDLPADQLCRIACRKCDRRGAYRRDTLAARFGADAVLPDVLARLAACSRRGDFSNPCGAVWIDAPGHTPKSQAALLAAVEAGRKARARENPAG